MSSRLHRNKCKKGRKECLTRSATQPRRPRAAPPKPADHRAATEPPPCPSSCPAPEGSPADLSVLAGLVGAGRAAPPWCGWGTGSSPHTSAPPGDPRARRMRTGDLPAPAPDPPPLPPLLGLPALPPCTAPAGLPVPLPGPLGPLGPQARAARCLAPPVPAAAGGSATAPFPAPAGRAQAAGGNGARRCREGGGAGSDDGLPPRAGGGEAGVRRARPHSRSPGRAGGDADGKARGFGGRRRGACAVGRDLLGSAWRQVAAGGTLVLLVTSLRGGSQRKQAGGSGRVNATHVPGWGAWEATPASPPGEDVAPGAPCRPLAAGLRGVGGCARETPASSRGVGPQEPPDPHARLGAPPAPGP